MAMARSAASTVDEYLQALLPPQREVLTALRALILAHLPAGYVEVMNWGMPVYEVPLARYSTTYNKQPLAYLAFAAQKNNYSLYLSCIGVEPEKEVALREAFASSGRKLDMGKACVRFRSLDDLPLEAIGTLIAATPVDEFIDRYERSRAAKP